MATAQETLDNTSVGVTTANLLVREVAGASTMSLSINETTDNLLLKLEADVAELRLQIISNQTQANAVEQELSTLRNDCNRLQTENESICTQQDILTNQLRVAEEQNAQLLAELNDFRQRAEASADEVTRARGRLAPMQQNYDQVTASLRNLEQNFGEVMSQALRSKRVATPHIRMSKTFPHAPEHKTFDIPYTRSLWIDLNGELAWINVLLALQHERLLAPAPIASRLLEE